MTSPKAIVDRLELVLGIDGSPQPLVGIIESLLVEQFGVVAIQASERAEALENAVAKIIADRLAEADDSGTIASLVLVGSASDIVAGSCYIFPTDETPIVSAKRGRLKVADLENAIRSLSFSDFEKFGARVLTELGAAWTRITPHSNDQGIDFYGGLSLGQFQGVPAPFLRLAHDVVFLFMGQAKHYPERSLGPATVRELIGAVALARTKTFSKADVDFFPDLELKPFSPAVTLLFTTGNITAGASQLARSAGIIAKSGSQIALFLADKGVGMETSGGATSFNEEKFRAWLEADS